MVLPAPQPGGQGEFLTSTVPVGSATSLTNTTPKDITSLLLSAGDWMVTGEVVFIGASWTTVASAPLQAGASQATGTLPATGDLISQVPNVVTTTSNTIGVPIPTQRLLLLTPTTVYLEARADFSAGTCTAYGRLEARRMR